MKNSTHSLRALIAVVLVAFTIIVPMNKVYAANQCTYAKSKSNEFDEKNMEKEEIVCGGGVTSYVSSKTTSEPKSAKYVIHQEKDKSVYYAKLTVKDDIDYSLQIMNANKKTIQTIQWTSYVSYSYVNFEDMNRDGYLDIVTALEEETRYCTHSIYVWNQKKQQYHEVKYLGGDMFDVFADITAYDGYVKNWMDGTMQVFIWKEEDLYRVYNNYCMPDGVATIATYKSKKHSTVAYNDLKFKIPGKYYIASFSDDSFYKKYVCKLKDKNSKGQKKFELCVSDAIFMDIQNYTQLKNYYLFTELPFTSYVGYLNLTNSSGIKALYKAVSDKKTYYYVVTENGAYEMTSDYAYLDKVILKGNPKPTINVTIKK